MPLVSESLRLLCKGLVLLPPPGSSPVCLADLPRFFIDLLHYLVAAEHANGSPPILGPALAFHRDFQFGYLPFEGRDSLFEGLPSHRISLPDRYLVPYPFVTVSSRLRIALLTIAHAASSAASSFSFRVDSPTARSFDAAW